MSLSVGSGFAGWELEEVLEAVTSPAQHGGEE